MTANPDLAVRDAVLRAVCQAIEQDVRIPMVVGGGDFRGRVTMTSLPQTSRLTEWAGEVPSKRAESFFYQFEGEDDLLHLWVERESGGPISPEVAQAVVDFVLKGFPPSLMWIKPGTAQQHFYLGHDELLRHLRVRG